MASISTELIRPNRQGLSFLVMWLAAAISAVPRVQKERMLSFQCSAVTARMLAYISCETPATSIVRTLFGGGGARPALTSIEVFGLGALHFRLRNTSRCLLCLSGVSSRTDYHHEGCVFCSTALHRTKGAGLQTTIYWLHHCEAHTSCAEESAKLKNTKITRQVPGW